VRLRRLKGILDEAYRVPGTNIRFGWDAIAGLIPGAGDIITALFSCGVIVQAHQMRVPRIVQLRMVLNVVIDLLIGFVPVAGDVADVFWKSNSKNFALLERHAAEPAKPTTGDWLFVTGVVSAVVAVALVPLVVVYWLVHQMISSGLLR